MTATYVQVRTPARGVGKNCMLSYCNRSATTTATRKMPNGLRLPVHFCDDHAAQALNTERG